MATCKHCGRAETTTHDDLCLSCYMTRIGFYSRDEQYGWLSNFHRSTMLISGKEYPTNEHFYQSQKAIGIEFQEWIRLAPNPYLAMKAGRLLRAGKPLELRPDWDDSMKQGTMLVGVRVKFADEALRALLLGTGNAYLYENSPNDTYWGLVNGRGENHLGKILMKVRDEIVAGMDHGAYYGLDRK